MARAYFVAIVDDDESVRESTTHFLRSLGYEAQAFASAEDFLETRDLGRVDCLITDIKMPGITGLDLQGNLAEGGYALPVIFVTAFPDETIQQRALEAGACGFFTKPVDAECLEVCVENAIANRSGHLSAG